MILVVSHLVWVETVLSFSLAGTANANPQIIQIHKLSHVVSVDTHFAVLIVTRDIMVFGGLSSFF